MERFGFVATVLWLEDCLEIRAYLDRTSKDALLLDAEFARGAQCLQTFIRNAPYLHNITTKDSRVVVVVDGLVSYPIIAHESPLPRFGTKRLRDVGGPSNT